MDRWTVDRWTVTDRAAREIYLTQERWEHIVSAHPELAECREDVLKTIRTGRRKQTKRDPQAFLYYRRVKDLPEPYDTITVVVVFRHKNLPETDKQVPNNFVVTAWGNVSASPTEER
ncbi:MAG: hypothetical protein HY023_02775 [Chloroflexi bacterium]|nr:hypothetical protein [Chloroflexota bacterium]